MKVVYSWLAEFVDLEPLEAPREGVSFADVNRDRVRKVTNALNALGMVVEGVEWVDPHLDSVVVASVLEISEIAGADHIRKVMVLADDPEPLQIVCGATNFHVGDLVPLAKVGAILPGDFTISKRIMKGVVSNGMLCSAKELLLSDDGAGLLILDPHHSVGSPLAEALGISQEVVFDLAIEANRPDANCVVGVARDLAPYLERSFGPPRHSEMASLTPTSHSTLEGSTISSSSECDALVLARLEGPFALLEANKVGRRLSLCGMRPISPVVDASNYVMLELGQPTHPYDFGAVSGGSLSIRRARDGEILETLDGASRELLGPREGFGGDLVICDAQDRVIGLAGVMGGASSEISTDTQSVLFEIAHFPRADIARTSKRLGLRSEASSRFERGVDPRGGATALARLCELLGTNALETAVFGDVDPSQAVISLRLSQVRRLLGITLDKESVASLIAPIGFRILGADGDVLQIEVPSFRPDCEREVDVIEEIARHWGYERFGKLGVRSPYVGTLTPYQHATREIRGLLRGRGLLEAMGATLVPDSDGLEAGVSTPPIFATNPLSTAESVLRMSLLGGMARAVRFNLGRREGELGFFEVGSVMSSRGATGDLPNERERLGVIVTNGAEPLWDVIDHLRAVMTLCRVEGLDISAFEAVDAGVLGALGDLPTLHSGRSGLVLVGGRPIGVVGELSAQFSATLFDGFAPQRCGYFEIDLKELLESPKRPQDAELVSVYMSSDLDLAFEVEESVRAKDLCDVVRRVAGDRVRLIELFDEFRSDKLGVGRKSLALRLRLESLSGTISDDDIAGVIKQATEAVGRELGGVLRGQ